MSVYSLNWALKDEAKRESFTKSRSRTKIKFSTNNLLVNGDNLDALKILAQEYKNKIDVIYIDPPYNTKNHKFVYEDNFAKDSTCRDPHSAWLNFIYPRLILACGILSDEGVIFISIDDNEAAQLKLVCDEIFGEDNFIAQFVWQKKNKPSFLHKKVSKVSEYILSYAKNRERAPMLSVEKSSQKKAYPLNFKHNPPKELLFQAASVDFNLSDSLIRASDMSSKTIECVLLDDVQIVNGKNANQFRIKGSWRYTQEYIDTLIQKGEKFTVAKVPFRINLIKQESKRKSMRNMLTKESYNTPTYEDATSEMNTLFGFEAFTKPKPLGLIKLLLESVTYQKKDALILDFFAGSGTTAEAVMRLNSEDGGTRRFILVQSSEATKKSSPAFKNGYTNIYEITLKRLKYSVEKYNLLFENIELIKL
ncbi:site-specific DNA-methyltransferase [bacterium]|nr:site-specific DNA-methyltransferase [bacterium]MBU1990393.1 site-specific DNA-methyltransferase [bacterium]